MAKERNSYQDRSCSIFHNLILEVINHLFYLLDTDQLWYTVGGDYEKGEKEEMGIIVAILKTSCHPQTRALQRTCIYLFVCSFSPLSPRLPQEVTLKENLWFSFPHPWFKSNKYKAKSFIVWFACFWSS